MKSTVSPMQARSLATALLVQFGAPVDHATRQSDTLIEAELRGHPSHGLLRLPRLLERLKKGLVDPDAQGDHQWTSPSLLRVDGQHGFGPVVAMKALDALSNRAHETGICLAAIRNANHLGMLAYYVEHAARRGQIALALSTSEALVHPWGGKQAMLGTNPLAIAIPSGDHPFVLDLATGLVSMGKIHDHALRGAPISAGWALDRNGNETTDANLAKSGSLAPFGEAKGYGLGLAIELLVASLAGSALAPNVRGTLDADHFANKGDVLIVIDPPSQPGLALTLTDYLDAVRHSPPQDETRPVRIPGDGARRRHEAALHTGLAIEGDLWAALTGALDAPLSPVFEEVSS